jgi:L-2-hydroxycarboxylate dehydrogenase (NAD+)
MTTDAKEVAALTTFGAHKGYGLSLINELVGAFIGGSLPTLRSREIPEGEKRTPAFYFQVIHPEAISGGAFVKGRDQAGNVKAVIDDILGHGNENCLLPGQLEAQWAKRVVKAGGLLFTEAEINAFNELAEECSAPVWSVTDFKAEA